MANTVQMNLNVLPTTKALVARIAVVTHRGKGDVVDLAIENLWKTVSAETVKSDPAVMLTDAEREKIGLS